MSIHIRVTRCPRNSQESDIVAYKEEKHRIDTPNLVQQEVNSSGFEVILNPCSKFLQLMYSREGSMNCEACR